MWHSDFLLITFSKKVERKPSHKPQTETLNMKIIFPILILMFALNNCSINKNSQSTAINADNLFGEWVHSHEEDNDNIKLFRLSTYDFPPSRGREKINLKGKGNLVYTPISPNDLPKPYNGTWKVDKSELILEYNNMKKTFKIIESTNSILKLK